MSGRRVIVRWTLLAVAVAALLVISTLLGPRAVSWSEIWRPGSAESVFWRLRVPRTLLAAAAGAGLAAGGVVFQILFRNPLAEPYTLGVASGASLAAALGFLFGWSGEAWLGVPRLVLLAFAGALAVMALVYLVSRLRSDRDLGRLLLAGVCAAYLCSAGILLVFFQADRAITSEIVGWMMGSLSALRPQAAGEVALVLIPAVALLAMAHRALDLLQFGPDLAATRGVHVGRVVWCCYALVGLLIAVIVANCGPIGFVGLMVPHLGRALFGGRTLPLLLGATLAGAGFLALCDGLARSLPVVELPVGVVTNILGGVFFLYLLATHDAALGPRS